MRTAVITVASGRHGHLRLQHDALLRSTVLPDSRVVVSMGDEEIARWAPGDPVVPHVMRIDPTPDGLPLAAARNLGARTAVGLGAELLVFLDVDCLPAPGLVEGYAAAAAGPARDHVLCGPVAYLPPAPRGGYDLDRVDELAQPHPGRPAPEPGEVVVDHDGHRLFWSLSFAVRTSVWERIGGFDEAYVGYGAEDTDFGQRAAAAGVPIGWVGDARAHHQHHPVSRPPVEHIDDVVRNAAIFHRRWGFWPMQTWLDAFVERGLVVRDDRGAYVRRLVGTPSTSIKEHT